MLNNPKWQHTKPETPSYQGFIAFLASQDPNRRYKWMSCETCAVGLYLDERCGGRLNHSADYPNLLGPKWPYHEICKTEPHTFGAALMRATAFAKGNR